MSKQIKQFRFYSNSQGDKKKNYPENIDIKNLVTGTIFADYMPISSLGIQAIPGTKFYLNNSFSPIVIGYTGLYELNMDDLTEITSLAFDNDSINKINENSETYLMVDIVYEKGEEE